jgi:hypothetical protein
VARRRSVSGQMPRRLKGVQHDDNGFSPLVYLPREALPK